MEKRFLVYGAGKKAKRYVQKSPGGVLLGFLQTQKTQDTFMNKPVYSVNELSQLSYDEIRIPSSQYEMLTTLFALRVPKNKILIVDDKLYGDDNILFRYLADNSYCFDVRYQGSLILTRPMNFRDIDFYTHTVKISDNTFLFNGDYTRYATLSLLMDEIKQRDITGEMAELGVYKGHFSRLMNQSFPNRKLYLFDTFTGFTEKDVAIEATVGCEKRSVGTYGDSNVEYVLKQMPHPESCIICKGRFPESIPNGKCIFALVSLDCDLYAPALAGLKYFYERLSEGGYILLHDYNGGYEGIKKAVATFEAENGRLCKVPIPDEAGTLIITK